MKFNKTSERILVFLFVKIKSLIIEKKPFPYTPIIDQTFIAHSLNISTKTVHRHLADLQAKGWLIYKPVTKQNGYSSTWILTSEKLRVIFKKWLNNNNINEFVW